MMDHFDDIVTAGAYLRNVLVQLDTLSFVMDFMPGAFGDARVGVVHAMPEGRVNVHRQLLGLPDTTTAFLFIHRPKIGAVGGLLSVTHVDQAVPVGLHFEHRVHSGHSCVQAFFARTRALFDLFESDSLCRALAYEIHAYQLVCGLVRLT